MKTPNRIELNTTEAIRAAVLAIFDDGDATDYTPSRHEDTELECGNRSFRVLTDSEADAEAATQVRGSLWAFNSGFILSECELPMELEEAFQTWQQKECESCNDAMESLIEKCVKGGVTAFAESAVSADGRVHFIAQYDGDENEQWMDLPSDATDDEKAAFEEMESGSVERGGIRFYIYRTN